MTLRTELRTASSHHNTLIILCWCGHGMKYHNTQQPNNCTKCETCQYFKPRGSEMSWNDKPIKAKFDGICQKCNGTIKASTHEIVRNSKRIWVHKDCSDFKKE